MGMNNAKHRCNMTIREMQKVINDYMADLPETSDGDIRVWHGKKEYSIRAVSGFGVYLQLNIETGPLTFDEEG